MMKRMIVMLMLFSVAVLGLGMRAEVASAEKDEVRTVAQAKNLKDGTNVTLIGYIVKYIGDDRYDFRDATGTIRLEIDKPRYEEEKGFFKDINDDDKRRIVAEKTRVEVRGEVDKDEKGVEIDVDSILKLGK